MVNFKADHAYFSSAMCTISTFRNNSSFCDVKLIICKQSLHAHRCVLAAVSPYFSSLFLGQFTEANMKEIDLSEVTSSITALERIVDYIYTGEIEIDEDNLEVIIKLSYFFLIDSLKEFWCTFITDKLSVTTCLRYYLISVDHSLTLIEEKTWPMVQTRFHDHLIYEEDTLSISTKEMQFLFEKHIFQHCSNVSILRFIAMWVNKGLTERHVMIAKDIFDYVIKRENSPQVCALQVTNELSVDSLYEMTESSLNEIDLEDRDVFFNTFKKVLGKLTTDSEIRTTRTRSQARHKGKETAIIAVFPSNDVIEHKKKIPRHNFHPPMSSVTLATGGHFLHVCAYIPRTRCWYSIKKIYNDGSSFASLVDEPMFDPYVVHDEFFLADDSARKIAVNNLNSLERSEIISGALQTFLQLESDEINSLYQNGTFPHFCLTAGKHDSVYLVTVCQWFEDDDFERSSGIHFNGYKLDNGNNWQKMFHTEVNAQYDVDRLTVLNMYAKISTVSNEMMIVRSDDEFNMVLVVDLNQENASPVTVLHSGIDDHSGMDIGRRTKIIETNDAMYIVNDGTTAHIRYRINGKVMVRYEYRLNSKNLREIDYTEFTTNQLQENTHGMDKYPCISEGSASVGDGLWYMEGGNNASFLTKVTIADNYKIPVFEQHTPPPFPSITAMFASMISSEILDGKKPVTRYLANECSISSTL